MEIIIDQRIELMTIIQTLCSYWDNLSKKFYNTELFQCKYKDNIKEYFEIYKKNETIELYNKLCNEEMDISTFLTLVLRYLELPNLSKNENCKENKYEYFIDSIRKFYEETKFDCFFKNNKNEYDKIINDFGNKEDILNEINNIFEYLDIDKKNYSVIISPLVFGNFGINAYSKNYIIISPLDHKDNKYIFDTKESIINIIRHEIGHTVINDLTKKYIDQNKYKNIEISEIFVKQFYNNMETVINEYIIRAITYLMEKDNNCAKALLNHEINSGFNEIESIKNYILEKCTEDNKLSKNNKYEKLIDYVIDKVSKSYCA